ncbi:MAG: ACP S-malonyltransferase [Enterobacterales bacterium]
MSSTCAIVFPGQGFYKIGILSKFVENSHIIKSTFCKASNILGYDLLDLVQNGPQYELYKIEKIQPAILTSSVCIWKIWIKNNGKIPKFIAGHSLGEYTALVCAGSLNFSDAIKLVEFRGNLMKLINNKSFGSMYVIIGLNIKFINHLCKKLAYGQIVSPASFNSPQQTVISGHTEAVQRVCNICKKTGAILISLPNNVPSHCELMKPISYKFKKELNKIKIKKPNIPVINNINAKIEEDPFFIKKSLVEQLYKPVQWIKIIKFFVNKKINKLFEMNYNKNVLAKLSKQISNKIFCISINNNKSLINAIQNITD